VAQVVVERRTVTVRGCRTSYVRGGSGPTLVFLHGFDAFTHWEPFMAGLAASYDVIVPDHPGYGESDIPSWLDGIHDLAFFYREFLATLGLAQVHVVGGGIGGWIALELAVRDTRAIASLTLIDAAGVRADGVDGIDVFLCTPEEVRRQSYVDPQLAERAATPNDERGFELSLKSGLTTARIGWQPRFFDPLLMKWLHQVDVPTLVLWGEDDAIFPLDHGRVLAHLIPGAKLIALPACGHLPHLEKPDDVVAAITAFLHGVPA
jgi:pimeloyl-ACP methyl ester carboxylesterase